MNSFDTNIISFFNKFAQRSYTFDQIIVFISGSPLLKGGVFAVLFWWLWFRAEDPLKAEHSKKRSLVMMMIVACFVSVFAVRILAAATPFKVRPIHNAELNFVVPHDMNTEILKEWNSFPSDHAAMFFALATCLWFVFPRLGIVSFIYVLIVICLPRVYLGLHYPTDIVAGSIVGLAVPYLLNIKPIPGVVGSCSSRWLRLHPASFYAFFFLVTFQVAVIFDDVRDISKFVFHILEVTVKFVE